MPTTRRECWGGSRGPQEFFRDGIPAWSTSLVGFMAPAFTPAVFLAGICLIGDTLTLHAVPWTPLIYAAICALFLVFHCFHAKVVHSRPG